MEKRSKKTHTQLQKRKKNRQSVQETDGKLHKFDVDSRQTGHYHPLMDQTSCDEVSFGLWNVWKTVCGCRGPIWVRGLGAVLNLPPFEFLRRCSSLRQSKNYEMEMLEMPFFFHYEFFHVLFHIKSIKHRPVEDEK